jgi:NAD(P)H-hydrate epimerase
MVVDADGLNILAGDLGVLGKPRAVRILTPHPGEMARLMGCSVKEVENDRMHAASSFARENGVVVVLKGAATVIADPGGAVAINPTGNAAMAAGGMGDVLAGIIVSLLGQGLSPWQAACLGVYAHGLAADRLVLHNKVSCGILASEVANELPLAFQDIA